MACLETNKLVQTQMKKYQTANMTNMMKSARIDYQA